MHKINKFPLRYSPSGRMINNLEGIFSRLSWSNYFFKWCARDNVYAYCTKKGEFLNAAYHDHDRSIVGERVLKADDIYRLSFSEENKQEGKKMNENNNYIGKYDMVAEVLIDKGINFNFKISNEVAKTLNEGDLVIVDKDNYRIGKVLKLTKRSVDMVAIRAFNAAKAWVVCKVDDIAHRERIANEERRKFIITQLDEKKKEIEEVQIYEMLAGIDPEANKLLEELKRLK